jgi:ABC-type multidrug transport system fused ATPase/permease subunit
LNLEGYLGACSRLDRSVLPLIAMVPRGWIIVGLLCLAPKIVSGTAAPATLAVAFGGILLGQAAIQKLTQSLAYLTGAMIAWRQVKPLFQDAAREDEAGSLSPATLATAISTDSEESTPVLAMYDVAFRHQGRAEKAIDGCNLIVRAGEQCLLEGPSGSGKSTLAALAGGLRQQQSGLILLRGLDRQTLGSRAWRRLVACVPQFGENHIFSATLAFNVLMGRRWPATPQDYAEAEQVCRELGLGELLDRMPGGLQQPVGETGWQLSFGERCRVFMARALLQGADFVIFDENLGSLDPETLPQVAGCIRRRASTLLVIAHP